MDGKPAEGARLIQEAKIELIDALSVDPDFVLQHVHAESILTQRQYDHVKGLTSLSDKARDILDFVMKKDDALIQRFLDLLRKDEMQEMFPTLVFLKEIPQNKKQVTEKTKRKHPNDSEEDNSPKKICKTNSSIVSEKQLMQVAGVVGHCWKQIGVMALEIPTACLEQIEEENRHCHRDKVFAMLRRWIMHERHKATCIRLHSLLSQGEFDISPGSIDFLLEKPGS
ncbi:uncharacterized protein LOC115808440 [Chanos chanos]|uniref:Uncharacterized protein LOC115808440 n=1 Tax=Chanos chanos TaxID=29144 RepID=A0A6J2V363_CHACN|nr:uncharacterized protein LOC115808440 [Chanos chanos]XP_030625671.1 uncharacterized protein LOC115808440 [Chanos chanos]